LFSVKGVDTGNHMHKLAGDSANFRAQGLQLGEELLSAKITESVAAF
jgi:hypothetical protein